MVISNLPWDLECEIISRVPATSLRQLRFACKRWYALCKDPRFIKKNSQCKAVTQMVLKNGKYVYAFNEYFEFKGKLKSLKNSKSVKICEIFHCEGLLLCTTKQNKLVVWNPCTGQTRRIIQSRLSSEHDTMEQKYFMGYENNKELCHRYKILRASWKKTYFPTEATFEMYELNSDSWRVLDGVTQNLLFYFLGLGVSLKGNNYWLDRDTLLQFDFTTERFGHLPLPPKYHGSDVLLSIREEKLAVLHHDSDIMEIWMTNNIKIDDEVKDLLWSKFLVVDLGKVGINCSLIGMSVLVDEENKMVAYCGRDCNHGFGYKTKIHVVEEDMCKLVYSEGGHKLKSSRLVSYVPSLVQIPARQSNLGGKRKR